MGLEFSADLQMSVDLESKRDFLTKRTLDELITISSNMGLDHEQLLRGVAKKKKTKTLVNSIIEKLEKNPNDFYCDVCGVVSTDKCSKCSSAFYCSAEHQALDWPSHKLLCKLVRSNADIRDAVNMWCSDPTRALKKYGHITEWNTSRVTNMMKLFSDKSNFNGDISKWNVDSVTNMKAMFQCAVSFNGDISGWNVSNVFPGLVGISLDGM